MAVDVQRFQDFLNTADNFNLHNHIEFTKLEPGYCECEVDLTHVGKNPQGVAHGSLVFALCDCVTGAASAAGGRSMLTLDANIQYLHAGKGPRLHAESILIKDGKTIGVYGARVVDADGTLVATAEFTIFYTGQPVILPGDEGETTWA